jgi:DNA-binding NarL/FixJ family response regulator
MIAEKNKLFIEVMKGISSSLGFSVIGTASNAFDMEAMALEAKPDLLLYDMQLSKDGMRLTDLKTLKQQLPQMKILVIGFHEASLQFVEEIIKAGFDGFWSKFGNRDELIEQLKAIFP